MSAGAPAPGSAAAWWRAARPGTLPVSLVPVMAGTAVAAAEGRARLLPALACGAAALLLQVGANFVNDYADHERGADAERLGPRRAAQSGWLTPHALRRGAATAFAAASGLGLYLVAEGGWPILLGGVLALLAAWAYTAGPFPLGYRGLGDVLVFAFFGLFAVLGTHAVQTQTLSAGALATAVPIGLLATAVLAVNNLRDLETDRASGKRTLAVRLGERGARAYTAALVVAGFSSLAGLAAVGAPRTAALLPLVAAPLALPVLRAVSGAKGRALNPALFAAARLELAFGVALSAGWVLGAVA